MVYPYLWIVTVGGFLAFATGAGVGMNDLSNAFGTTYGAKVLTLTQIVILASICEFGGAIALGGAVTSTISGGIANPSDFSDRPYVFMYGMLCALGATFCWLTLATWLTLPVSSTHSICGGVIGFALVYGGANAVRWAEPQSEFPFVGGVVPIVASWFISPLLTGIVAAIIYGTVRALVLRPANSALRAMYTLPLIVAITFFLESFFVLYKGAKNRLHWEVSRAAWVAACIAAAAGCLSIGFIPLLKFRLRRLQAQERAAASEYPAPEQEGVNVTDAVISEAPFDNAAEVPRKKTEATGAVINDDAQSSTSEESGSVVSEEEAGEREVTAQIYDKEAEFVYRYLQIFTAVCASFAHGASDVSNAVGPFAAIYNIYATGAISSKSETPIWVLCLGGAGLVIGLATFGVRLMRLLGEKITLITPSRGFSAELAAALVVSFASGYGIPVSSTHCITGAVVTISILDLGFRKVRWMMVLKMYGGWVFTIVVTAFISATFFAQGVYSPSM